MLISFQRVFIFSKQLVGIDNFTFSTTSCNVTLNLNWSLLAFLLNQWGSSNLSLLISLIGCSSPPPHFVFPHLTLLLLIFQANSGIYHAQFLSSLGYFLRTARADNVYPGGPSLLASSLAVYKHAFGTHGLQQCNVFSLCPQHYWPGNLKHKFFFWK